MPNHAGFKNVINNAGHLVLIVLMADIIVDTNIVYVNSRQSVFVALANTFSFGLFVALCLLETTKLHLLLFLAYLRHLSALN